MKKAFFFFYLSYEKCGVVAGTVLVEQVSTFWSYTEEKSSTHGRQLGMKDGLQTSVRGDVSAGRRV